MIQDFAGQEYPDFPHDSWPSAQDDDGHDSPAGISQGEWNTFAATSENTSLQGSASQLGVAKILQALLEHHEAIGDLNSDEEDFEDPPDSGDLPDDLPAYPEMSGSGSYDDSGNPTDAGVGRQRKRARMDLPEPTDPWFPWSDKIVRHRFLNACSDLTHLPSRAVLWIFSCTCRAPPFLINSKICSIGF
jgi:hypothetical protein